MAPLHMAAERGRFYLVEKFARKQADINIKNDNGVKYDFTTDSRLILH